VRSPPKAPMAAASLPRQAVAPAHVANDVPARDPESSAPASLDPALRACHTRLRAIHGELVAVEADLVEWDLDYAFALGEANPAAEQELGPLIVARLEQWSRAVGFHLPLMSAEIVEHRFRCRTWACRLALRLAKPVSAPERYRDDVRSDPAVMPRVSEVQGHYREWEGDLLERDDSFIYVVQLRLRQPSGAPLPAATIAPPPRPLPRPATVASCAATAATLAEELASERDRWERVEPLDHKFDRSPAPPDPELARLVESRQPWFTNLLAVTECRGRVCKQTSRYSLLGRTFWDKPAGGVRTANGQGTGVTYLELPPP
jgi:hypothetical protein